MSIKSKNTILIFTVVGFLAISAFAYFFIFQKPETATAETSATFYATGDSGYVYKSRSTYSSAFTYTTGTVLNTGDYIRIGQYYGGGLYRINRSFLIFDTSSIPSNAIITSATLSLYQVLADSDQSATDFDIVIQNGQPDYPNVPLVTGDYYYAHYSGDGGSINTSNLSDETIITLNADGLSWIQKGVGVLTKLALRSSRDINQIQPSGYEYVYFYDSDHDEIYFPKLVVNYTLSAAGTSTKISSGIKIGNGIIFK
jgi:hypothetical protein